MNLDPLNLETAPPAAAREPPLTGQALTRLDDHFYEELSRINNELANLQRELARTNAGMAATQKKLAISEQRFRNLSASLPIGIFELDSAGRCIYTNSHWQTISGLSAQESLGDGWQRALDQRDAPAFLEERNLARQSGRELSHEVRFVNARGDQRWAQVRSRDILAGGGEAAGRVSTVEDITERKRTEELLRRSEEKFRGFVENLRDAVMTLDPATHKFSSANPAAIRMFDAKNEQELLSFSPGSLSPERQPDGSLSVEKARQRTEALDAAPQCFEWVHQRISGAVFFAEVMLTRMEHGSKPVVLATIRDITARKQAEDILRKKEHLLSESQRLGHIGGWFSDVTGPVSWSEETYRIYGVSPDTFILNMASFLGLVHPDDRPALLDWQARCATGQKPDELEFRIIRPDGSIRFIKRNGEAVYDAGNRLIHMAGTIQDITEHKQAQASRAALERRVAELKANEESARLALEHEQKSSRIKDRFVSLVSHEFRTPLSIINMAAALLDGYLDRLTAAERSEHLQEILGSVERMTQMMNDFIIHVNCAGNKVECQPAWVEVEALCQQLISELPHDAGSPRVFECAVEPSVGGAWLDAAIVRHILGNLLSNAVKYSSAGQPVKLEVRRIAGRMQPNGGTDTAVEPHLEFKVTDSGIGIPAADLARLYETFHRAANVGNRPGTGMGLAIVKQFVDLLGGRIRIESEEGKGTTVWVELPATAPASPAKR
jgi:PAS domain S-box-containing protein